MKRFSSLLLAIFILVACQSQVDVAQTIPANTATPEITLTTTKQPTTPPKATQTLSIEFPDWVKNPDTQILLVPVGTRDNGYENMALFNAETGERFDIPFTDKVGDYFWMPDGSAFGFLPEEKPRLTLFQINDGQVKYIPLSEETLKFYFPDSHSNSIQVSSLDFTEANFLIIPYLYPLSPDRKYFEYQEQSDYHYTSVFDISENQIIYLSDPNDEYIDLYSAWSPTSSLLAVVTVDEEPEMWNSFKVLPNFRLQIYDVKSQQVIASYKNVTLPLWSPDGKKFLFLEYDSKVSPPCIFDTINGETDCYNELAINNDIYFGVLSWSPNQSMISYIASDQGFCRIILFENKSTCSLGNLPENHNVRNYSWSSNSFFISFVSDSSGLYSDFIQNPKLGIANTKTGEYFFISESVNLFHTGLWRPSPNP